LSNPFVSLGDKFVVLGFDGFNRTIFPCGSFNSADEARSFAISKTQEEPQYSDDQVLSTTFYAFTIEGTHIPLE